MPVFAEQRADFAAQRDGPQQHQLVETIIQILNGYAHRTGGEGRPDLVHFDAASILDMTEENVTLRFLLREDQRPSDAEWLTQIAAFGFNELRVPEGVRIDIGSATRSAVSIRIAVVGFLSVAKQISGFLHEENCASILLSCSMQPAQCLGQTRRFCMTKRLHYSP